MQATKLLFAIVAAFLLLGLASAASVDFVAPTTDVDIVTDGVIDYNAEVSDVTANQVVDFDVVLYTDDYSYVSGNEDWSNVLNVQGSFSNVEDGDYILYAGVTFLDGTTDFSTQSITVDREFSVDNPISVLYSDPTPANGSLVNSHNIDAVKIVAVADEVVDEMTIIFYNDSNDWAYTFNNIKKTDFMISEFYSDAGDGTYTYYVAAEDEGEESNSKERTIVIKAVVPTASDINVTGLPESINEDVAFSFVANMSVSEQPVKVRAIATKAFVTRALGTNTLSNYTGEELVFTGTIADPGIYMVAIVVSDDYGNSNRYDIGNITVNDVAELAVEEERRRGGRGNNGNDDVVNNTRPASRFNLTLVDVNDQDEEEVEETEEQTDENPGFFSFITGAVTGAFSTPPRAILTFIIIIVIIYAIIKIRGYVVADEEKPKKNGKKSKAKDKVDEEEPSEE